MNNLLEHINSPDDLKQCDIPQLAQLSKEIRDFIISNVANTGGHLAPSLGVVELTLALHYVFQSPNDKIVWDVGHQSYAHKIVTGRRDRFHTIRQQDGLSGFPKISESEHDAFGVGHASTAISAAFGMACGRDIAGKDFAVISIVGDGALTGGLAYEGMNNAGASGRDMIVILNDNSMSISPNVGAISKYLTSIISNPLYNKLKKEVWEVTGKFDNMGSLIRRATRRVEESLKHLVIPGVIFERLGFRYFGPIDGHNISQMIHIFREIRKLKGPIVVHLLTKKGKGYAPAEKNAPIFHGLGAFDPVTGEIIKKTEIPTYTSVFGETLVELAKDNESLCAITAAMQIGTGLTAFSETYPERFFDVGIAEGHAVTFAAGLACQHMHPVVAIYSSFLQRSYDHVIHDVALQKLPVIFALDRAGLVGDDGPTHHGVFDLAFLRTIPGLVIMAPKDENELRQMTYTASNYVDGPIALRYPRGQGEGVPMQQKLQQIPIGVSEVMREGVDIAIIAAGPLVYRALEAAERLEHEDGLSTHVINARFMKPLDTEMLTNVGYKFKLVLTIEEGCVAGGMGSGISDFMAERRYTPELIQCGIPDSFVEQGKRELLFQKIGLDAEGIVKAVRHSKYYKQRNSGLLNKLNISKQV